MHYTAPPVIGGVEQVLSEQAAQLRGAGHDVVVIAGRGDCRLLPELDSRHPAVEELARKLAAGDPGASQFESLRRSILSSMAPMLEDREVVIAHNLLTMPFNLPGAAALVDSGKPVLAWTHDHAWLNPRYQAFQRQAEPYLQMRRLQPRTRYVAISETRQAELADLYGVPRATISVVPNGVDPDAFLGISAATRALLAGTGLGAGHPLVLAPVRITRRKRLELGLEVAAELRIDNPGLRLLVTGPLGPHDSGNQTYWAQLREQRRRLGLEGAVGFLHEQAGDGSHPVSDRTMAELYRLADLVLLTSESEGFGLPVAEAALARVPIVCANIPVLREVGAGGAHLYPAGSGATAIAETCRTALASEAAAFRTGVLDRYSWPSVLRRTEAVIAECARHG